MNQSDKLKFLYPEENYGIEIDFDKKETKISETFIGVFFEDINYGADGGLYAELIQNRSFEFGSFKESFSKFDDYLYGWEVFEKDNKQFKIERKNEQPIHPNNPNYLEITLGEMSHGSSLSNTGFGGIALRKNENYNFSIFLRNKDYNGKLHILLQGQNGTRYAKVTIESKNVDDTWKKYETVLNSEEDDSFAKLSLIFEGEGTLNLDMISLFPQSTWANRKNGLRRDLVQMLKDLNPKFMRFPGGCIVEGKYLSNAYNWKDTIGPVEYRKTNWNRWEEWQNAPYNQTYGLGFYEYFQLSEDIGASPLPIINCGMSCQFQGKEVADDVEPFIQDALDLIEYANGDETTIWGSKRIEAGHKEPFNLVYLGIGNEQWIDYEVEGQDKYFETYEIFRKRIKEKYPDVHLITTSGPFPSGKEFEVAWDIITDKTKEYIDRGKVYAEIIDEHYYMSPDWFLDNNSRYDSYPRYEDGKSSKIFAGEYACHTNGGPSKQGENNLYAALCEAAFMTGLERNSDIVAMTAYAPLFAKTTNIQWQPDLIWFDNNKAYGSVSYYVQKMFGNNMGTYTLKTDVVAKTKLPKYKRLPIYSIASYDANTEEMIIKLVNVDEKAHTVSIELKNVQGTWQKAKGVILTSENKMDMNTLEEPDKVVAKDFILGNVSSEFVYDMPAQSFVVLRLKVM
ncbi:alpha-L-arabinofuranosidase C-terminal domain-containing protein [Cellulosilyticum sp. I15G10I2]|uniref:alpha-L-arabinofuranosidase C-terminal domain-containing protein n=1 Tax=Cellulosilyticum sp. I15G10I2 TaxID=1892843 RepID=UPI00085CD7A0|nr:alpha-L-arabinofuranosidase C-terminal domain-containing protein [Cellulosilyticum sp. I15G10I2]